MTEPTAAVRHIPVAITRLPECLDAAGAERATGIRDNLAAPGGTLAKLPTRASNTTAALAP